MFQLSRWQDVCVPPLTTTSVPQQLQRNILPAEHLVLTFTSFSFFIYFWICARQGSDCRLRCDLCRYTKCTEMLDVMRLFQGRQDLMLRGVITRFSVHLSAAVTFDLLLKRRSAF